MCVAKRAGKESLTNPSLIPWIEELGIGSREAQEGAGAARGIGKMQKGRELLVWQKGRELVPTTNCLLPTP